MVAVTINYKVDLEMSAGHRSEDVRVVTTMYSHNAPFVLYVSCP